MSIVFFKSLKFVSLCTHIIDNVICKRDNLLSIKHYFNAETYTYIFNIGSYISLTTNGKFDGL